MGRGEGLTGWVGYGQVGRWAGPGGGWAGFGFGIMAKSKAHSEGHTALIWAAQSSRIAPAVKQVQFRGAHWRGCCFPYGKDTPCTGEATGFILC